MLLAPEGDPDAPDIPTPRSYAEAITGPYSSQWQASWTSTGTYVNAVPPPGANIVDGMWIFRVKRPPGSPPAFKARYVARGFNQRQGVVYFQTFSPTPKVTTLRVLLHVAAQRDYELHSKDFSTAFLTTLAALGLTPSTAYPTPLLLLLTSLVLRMSGLLLLLRSAAAARARVAGVVAVAAGVVVGAAVEVVEAVKVVAVVGVVAGVGAMAAAIVAAVGVAVVAEVGVVVVGMELLSGEVLAVARGSNSSVGARPRRPSSFVSEFLSMGRLGVVLPARMSFARVTVLVRHAGSLTLSTAASPA
ncbi:unnamed protein product [Closterium sp. NIES-54]